MSASKAVFVTGVSSGIRRAAAVAFSVADFVVDAALGREDASYCDR